MILLLQSSPTKSILFLAFFLVISSSGEEDVPPCELCGCSFCTPGEFPVGNPNGIIESPEGTLDEEGQDAMNTVSGLNCGLLEFVMTQVTAEECTDKLRLVPEFRELCECPPLPPRPPSAPAPPPTTSKETLAPVPYDGTPDTIPNGASPQRPTVQNKTIDDSQNFRRLCIVAGVVAFGIIVVGAVQVKKRRQTVVVAPPYNPETEQVQRQVYLATVEAQQLGLAIAASQRESPRQDDDMSELVAATEYEVDTEIRDFEKAIQKSRYEL